MLEEIINISQTHDIGCCLVHGKPRPTERPTNRVVWLGMPRCQAILRLVSPYLVSKKQHAEVMLNAINHRTMSKKTSNGYGHSAVQQDSVLIDFISILKKLNMKGSAVHMAVDQSVSESARQQSALGEVVGAVDGENIPTRITGTVPNEAYAKYA